MKWAKAGTAGGGDRAMSPTQATDIEWRCAGQAGRLGRLSRLDTERSPK